MRRASILTASVVCLLLAVPAWADKDKDKGRGHDHGQAPSIAAVPGKGRVFVTERDRSAVYTFYRTEYVGGRCPPGLARADIGCLPPGQAKRLWAIGAPLPPSLVFYPLPQPLLAQLTPAPEGYQYIRVDNDILLMALGTRVVAEPVGNIGYLQEANRPLVSDYDRSAIVSYYRDDYLAGNCPDGLVRTDQGCQAPRLWALGEPLAPDVAYEALPQPLLGQLDPIPDGYSYIRLGQNILLMSLDSRIIRAEVADLSRLPLTRPAVPVTAPGVVVVPERVEIIGGGGCPPGLAKKNNGCLPPGHAK
jgi:hypothetical protein